MFEAIWTVTLTAALAPVPDPPHPEVDRHQPKLIIKEKEYFIHALPPESENWHSRVARTPTFKFRESSARGLVLLHTSTTTGEMKVLAGGGLSVGPDYRNSAPPVYLTYIAGVAADRERLFVLQWSHSDFDRGVSGGKYSLLVFRPGDGKMIRALEIEKPESADKLPRETPDRGPLRLHDDGVSCLGTRYVFDGTELIKQSAEKKP
jgi:hypothetical protein